MAVAEQLDEAVAEHVALAAKVDAVAARLLQLAAALRGADGWSPLLAQQPAMLLRGDLDATVAYVHRRLK